ncbi:reverse transcriptase domain-containing protein [Tanacetum coccineum]
MRTRSSSHLITESSTTPKCHNRRRSKQRVEPFSLEETPVVTMADQRTMAKLLRAPTEITSTLKYKNVPETSIKLMLFHFLSMVQSPYFARQDTSRSIPHWDDLIVECLALVDLGAGINLMPLSIWKKLLLPELTPTRMILELEDRSTTSPSGIAEDVFVKVRKFHFPADFMVLDYVVDPRVPLILGRPFLRMTQVLGFLDSSTSGNPTPSLDPILSTSFPSLTHFEGGDFILEEIKAYLTNDSIPPGIDDADFDPEGDLLLFEKLLSDDPSPPLPPKELHFEEIKTIKFSIDDPLELELKDLPSHLEYMFLEGTNKLPVIISKELKDEEKAALLKVLKSHKRAIAWKISDIKGIDPSFCTHKILMEYDFKPAIQHQRRVNLKIHEVIKLLDAGLIYHISESPKGIVLRHKISKSGIEVDKAKVDVIAKLPHPTSIKGVRSFLGHASKMLSRDCSGGFFYSKNLTSLFMIKKGAENLTADHLSKLENPHQGDLEKKEINETFPFETL